MHTRTLSDHVFKPKHKNYDCYQLDWRISDLLDRRTTHAVLLVSSLDYRFLATTSLLLTTLNYQTSAISC